MCGGDRTKEDGTLKFMGDNDMWKEYGIEYGYRNRENS
jgi:hypothetical protein